MRIPILIFALCLILKGFGQDIYHEHLDQLNGLPCEQIFDIYCDQEGYLWMSSDRGLIKYNGLSYKLYYNENGYSSSGSLLSEDKFGRVWFESFDGYFFYLDESDSLRRIEDVNVSGFWSYAILGDYLFYSSESGLNKVNIVNFDQENIFSGKEVLYCQRLNELILFGDGNDTYTYDPESNGIELLTTLSAKFNSIVSFSDKNKLYLSDRSVSNPTIYSIDKNGLIDSIKIDLGYPLQNIKFYETEIDVFTKNGIYRFDKNFHSIEKEHVLNGKNVSSATIRKNGSIWVSSPTDGIYLIKDWRSTESSIAHDQFSSLAIDNQNNSILAGTNSGKIISFDHNLNSSLLIDTEEKNHILFLDFNSVEQWNFYTGNGFFVEDVYRNFKCHAYFSVKDIEKIDEQRILVCGTGFAAIVDLSSNNICEDVYSNKIIDNVRAKSGVYNSQTEEIFVASNNGLLKWKNGQCKEILFNNTRLFASSLEFHNNRTFGINQSGNLFYLENESVKPINSPQKLNKIRLDNNRLYCSSEESIYQLSDNEKFEKLVSIGGQEQILDFQVLNDTVYILTANKLIKTAIANEPQSIEVPKVIIKGITFGDHQGNINFNNIIDPIDNQVIITYEIINFNFHIDYEYQFLVNSKPYPFDPNSSQIYLPELGSGQYLIELRIINSKNGIPIFETEKIQFEILPPIWKRAWVLFIIVLILIVTIVIIYRSQIRRIRAKNLTIVRRLQLENNLKDSRLQLIKSQMNPHFFFNAINNIQSYIFTNETKEASLYLSKFSKLTRKILEFSEVDIITLKEELEALELYLELQKMRFKEFDFKISVTFSDSPDHIKIPTMLFQPYVENAILHGLSHKTGEKKISIHFDLIENSLVCTVSDNGVGRIKSAEINAMNLGKPKSFATKANMERIRLLNQDKYEINIEYFDLEDDDHSSLGTKVVIQISL